jgi:hypothetical protein
VKERAVADAVRLLDESRIISESLVSHYSMLERCDWIKGVPTLHR